MVVVVSQDEKTKKKVLTLLHGSTSVGLNVPPGVKYQLQIFSTVSRKPIIGLPLTMTAT